MIKINRPDLSFMFNKIAESLDISDTQYDEAVKRYRAVGTWLGEEPSPLAAFSPNIYPQGSFLLGTVTKRWGENNEYDIDLVFEMKLSKDRVSQETIKNFVGDRLKESEIYRPMLDKEGRRCWTVMYSSSAQFHLDILPAIPNDDFRLMLKNYGVPKSWADTGIAITDKTRPNYALVDPDWPCCNPIAYASWFRSRMTSQFNALRQNLAEAMKVEIQDVPEYRVKTPLQRCVQLIKRHRDVAFEKKNDKPASIILTTLAALSYNNEIDITQSLASIVMGMSAHITEKDGVRWVQNPVNPTENFADRWQDPQHPNRQDDFYSWLEKLQQDLRGILAYDDISFLSESLSLMFGEKLVDPVIESYQESVRARTRVISIPASTSSLNNKPWGG